MGPQQLVRSGGENDPLDVKITIVNEHQLSMAMGPQAGPVPPRYEFCVIDGKIIPGLSSGKRDEIFTICLLSIHLCVLIEALCEFL